MNFDIKFIEFSFFSLQINEILILILLFVHSNSLTASFVCAVILVLRRIHLVAGI